MAQKLWLLSLAPLLSSTISKQKVKGACSGTVRWQRLLLWHWETACEGQEPLSLAALLNCLDLARIPSHHHVVVFLHSSPFSWVFLASLSAFLSPAWPSPVGPLLRLLAPGWYSWMAGRSWAKVKITHYAERMHFNKAAHLLLNTKKTLHPWGLRDKGMFNWCFSKYPVTSMLNISLFSSQTSSVLFWCLWRFY